MGIVVRPHAHPDGAVARPDHVNANETILYNEINGNLDWENLKAALQNAANGLVKLDGDALVPLSQIPVLTADKLPTVIPAGVIVMWSGTLGTIPAGWSLCNGAGGTPDLRDKFIYGCSNGEDPGDTGGALIHTHTYSDVPTHNHSVTDPGHKHQVDYAVVGSSGSAVASIATPGLTDDTSTVVTGITIGNSGVASPETDAGSTLPPYYKLAFIQKD